MKEPLVSVIVPVYNVADYLSRCVESIIAQTYSSMEIILVDDGSIDGSEAICDQYSRNDKRIHVIHKENGGLSSARNSGIKKAKGEYLVFVDADDCVEGDYVAELMMLIKKYGVDMAAVGMDITTGIIKSNLGSGEVIVLDTEGALESMMLERYFSVSANGKIYKKSLFRGVKYPEGRLYEDNGCTYKLIRQCDEVVYCDKKLYHYCVREGSITSEKFSMKKMDYIELTDEACSEIVAKYPSLKDACKCRQAVVRISILRQMLNAKLNQQSLNNKADIKKWLKSNTGFLLMNILVPKKVKVSVMALNISEKLLKLIGIAYEKSK